MKGQNELLAALHIHKNEELKSNVNVNRPDTDQRLNDAFEMDRGDDEIERDLQRFADLLIDETTDLYYKERYTRRNKDAKRTLEDSRRLTCTLPQKLSEKLNCEKVLGTYNATEEDLARTRNTSEEMTVTVKNILNQFEVTLQSCETDNLNTCLNGASVDMDSNERENAGELSEKGGNKIIAVIKSTASPNTVSLNCLDPEYMACGNASRNEVQDVGNVNCNNLTMMVDSKKFATDKAESEPDGEQISNIGVIDYNYILLGDELLVPEKEPFESEVQQTDIEAKEMKICEIPSSVTAETDFAASGKTLDISHSADVVGACPLSEKGDASRTVNDVCEKGNSVGIVAIEDVRHEKKLDNETYEETENSDLFWQNAPVKADKETSNHTNLNTFVAEYIGDVKDGSKENTNHDNTIYSFDISSSRIIESMHDLSWKNIYDMLCEFEREVFIVQPKYIFHANTSSFLRSFTTFYLCKKCCLRTNAMETVSLKNWLGVIGHPYNTGDGEINSTGQDSLLDTCSHDDRKSVIWEIFESSLGTVPLERYPESCSGCNENESENLVNWCYLKADASYYFSIFIKHLPTIEEDKSNFRNSYDAFEDSSAVKDIVSKMQKLSFKPESSGSNIAKHKTSFNNEFLEFIKASQNRGAVSDYLVEANQFCGYDGRVKERKTYLDQDIDDDEIEGKRTYNLEERLASTKHNKSFVITDLRGEDFNLKYLQENGLQYPILFKDKTGLGLRVPSENFQVSDVKACVGSRRVLDVMDVTTQKGMEMTMKEWVKYYENPEKDKLLNVISLEFSHTKLENYVESPSLVREVDWVDIAWPQHLKDCQTESTNVIDKMKYPKVQKYCLMSVKGCYTDFHIDFGGTSVWYHILHGEKVFWLIPPTARNVSVYENWVLSGKQGDVFLADVLNDCQKITLMAGCTFIIPSGWIHAVYTPKDSLVFGGNFLHSFNIDKQLMVSGIEEKTHVPGKFRYPFYAEIGWYVLERYVHCITGQTYLEKPKLSDDLEFHMSGMSTSPESPLTDDVKTDSGKLEPEILTPKLPKRVAVTLTRIDNAYSQSPRRPSSSDDDSMASGPPISPRETTNGHALYRKSSTESSNSVQDDSKQNKTHLEAKSSVQTDKSKGKEGSSVKKKLKNVHLTKYEKIGLTKLVQWIEDLPPTKKGIPKDLLNAEAVLREMKHILEEHMNDSEKLAATGEPILVWTKATKKLIKLKQKAKLMGATAVSKGTGKSSKAAGERHRRVRCKRCEPCTRADCRECNFCKDMKKFGGPGRMKQSCISRQCLAPRLANSAVCLICKEDSHVKDESGEMISTLMECGICWEIVHPNCLKKKYENLEGDGAVNEDLPNSWICPKCSNDGKEKHLKPRVFKGGWRPSPAATPSPVASPNPDHHPGEDLVTEGKRVTSKHPLDQAKTYIPKSNPGGNLPSPGTQSSSNPSPWQPADEKSEIADVKEEVASEMDMEVEEEKPIEKPPSSQSSVKKSVKRKSMATQDRPDSAQKKARISLSVSPKGKGKSPKPQKPVTSRSTGKKLKKSPTEEPAAPSPDPLKGGRPKREEIIPVPPHHPSTSYDFDDSELADNQTLALPLLEKGKGVAARGGRRQKSGKWFRTQVPEGGRASGVGGVGVGPNMKQDVTGSPIKQFSMRKKPEDIGKSLLEHIEKRGLKTVPQKYVVRPAPVSPPKNFVELTTGDKHVLPCTVWTKIFSYLPSADLARCLCVCRVWNRWCINPELWKEIDLSRKRIVQNHLMGIVRRQPEALILSSVIMTPKQLKWLIERNPLLKKLVLSKCSGATMGGLCTSACPLLTELDISWASGITDQFFEDLITPPVDRKPAVKNISRLHRLKILRVGGTEITDHSLNLLSVHLSRLEVLDLSYCTKLTDKSISILSSSKSATQETLRVLSLAGCRQLSEASLQLIKNFKHLNFLNLSKCNKIPSEQLRHFKMTGLIKLVY